MYTLLIKLLRIETHSSHSQSPVYFSFMLPHSEQHHFSSAIAQEQTNLTDDIIIQSKKDKIPDLLHLHRWENHMIMFTHEIDLYDLHQKGMAHRKWETKKGELLEFLVTFLAEEDIMFSSKYQKEVSQHYLLISEFRLLSSMEDNSKKISSAPSYFSIKTPSSRVYVPVTNASICRKLPQTIYFEYTKNGITDAKSQTYKSNELSDKDLTVPMKSKNGQQRMLIVQLEWGLNLSHPQHASNILDTQQVIFYDIQISFQHYDEHANAKVKFIYGSKAFQIGNQFNNPKIKVRKVVHFSIRSEDQEINIITEKNGSIVSYVRFYSDEILPYQVNMMKKKIIDVPTGRQIGLIKYKCEKGKQISTPQINTLWREYLKKKNNPTTFSLAFQQFSLFYKTDHQIAVIIKTESHEKIIFSVPNFGFFHIEKEVDDEPFFFTIKNDEQVYMMIKELDPEQQSPKVGENDFLGIAAISHQDFRLGMNCIEVPFFKNKVQIALVNCMVHKMIPHSFVKHTFFKEPLPQPSQKSLNINMVLNKIIFSPYYYTYRYDNKNEVFGIVEVNKQKRVLIMENHSKQLLKFTPNSQSDNLNFLVQHSQFVKIKVTFMVSDIGQEEEVYGILYVKFRVAELNQDALYFDNVEFENDYGIVVGKATVEVHRNRLKKKQSKIGGEDELRVSLTNSVVQIDQKMEIQNENGKIEKQKDKEKVLALSKLERKQSIKEMREVKQQKQYQQELKEVKNELQKVNDSMEKVERFLSRKSIKMDHPMISPRSRINHSMDFQKSKPRYSYNYQNDLVRFDKNKLYGRMKNNKSSNEPVKFPEIKKEKPKQNNLQQLVKLIRKMKIRRRKGRTGESTKPDQNVKAIKTMRQSTINKQKEEEQHEKQIVEKMKHLQQIEEEQKKQQSKSLRKSEKKKSEKKINIESVEWKDNEFAQADDN